MRAIYLDCFSGISGNMFLGALLDAGLPLAYLKNELQKLPVSGYDICIKQVEKRGINAVYANVKMKRWMLQPSRHLQDIVKIINTSTLKDNVKANALRVFERLAKAEAKVHGEDIHKVHFHEVGAVDAIVDIVGTMIGLEYLAIDTVFVSSLHVGSGFVKCSHGRMPVPAPATAELLIGIPFYAEEVKGELVTPTGAALVSTLGSQFGKMPSEFVTEKIAYGAGSRDLEIANVVRMYLGKIEVENWC